jgi:hypothetical protein
MDKQLILDGLHTARALHKASTGDVYGIKVLGEMSSVRCYVTMFKVRDMDRRNYFAQITNANKEG